MAVSIREYDAKRILGHLVGCDVKLDCIQVKTGGTIADQADANPWLRDSPLVVKPDVLLKRRGKSNLILLNASMAKCDEWLASHVEKEVEVEGLKGVLDTFIVEPFVPHNEEYYICINSTELHDEILFYDQGGVDVGDVDAKAYRMTIGVSDNGGYIPEDLTYENIRGSLLIKTSLVKDAKKEKKVIDFIMSLYNTYVDGHFIYMEINPFCICNNSGNICVLDCACKLDHTADFVCERIWPNDMEFPSPFGRRLYPEESYIRDLDSKTGASLKLTILNPLGRIWTMIAGGGASVIYTDTICDLGYSSELCNYGEYSGAPTETITYEYSKTILSLICKKGTERKEGKILLIGGGIANFTSVSDTFKGIIRSLKEYSKLLHEFNVKIYVRRGGPNYRDGLRLMRDTGIELGLDIYVFGPETYITSIIPLALNDGDDDNKENILKQCQQWDNNMNNDMSNQSTPLHHTNSFQNMQDIKQDTKNNNNNNNNNKKDYRETGRDIVDGGIDCNDSTVMDSSVGGSPLYVKEGSRVMIDDDEGTGGQYSFIHKHTECVVYGLQTRAVQEMLDFDHVCGRVKPSVCCIIYEFSQSHMRPFYFGNEEVFLPVYKTLQECIENHKTCTVMINFASRRSAINIIRQCILYKQFTCITTIAEGIPERYVRGINMVLKREIDEKTNNKENNRILIGPSTVGGIRPGCLRIGNTGGSLENIMNLKLYRPGNVGLVTKSGGMLNELNNILFQYTNGIYEGIAIGGDRYPSSKFKDHIMRYVYNDNIKMIVVLGECGGLLEYDLIDMKKSGLFKDKPIIAWCTGTCSSYIKTEVSFGHSGAYIKNNKETALCKNSTLRENGINVPESFNRLGDMIKDIYRDLVNKGTVTKLSDKNIPRLPMDYSWAKKLGLIRKKKEFISTISDDRGDELMYAGWPISKVVGNNIGVGGVICLLWFKRPLPDYCYQYIEKILILTADHGPAVCGAHNTIVTARAGKDLISSLISGLCTIGERFGGACDAAAQQFLKAHRENMKPHEFVQKMKQTNQLIMGIGHRIKSIHNPDSRVSILKEFCLNNFTSTPLISFALEVEQVTTKKKDSLILNVDGLIGVSMVDMLMTTNCFTPEEAQDYIDMGCINGLFVLGRSIGFIAHYLDQKRLKQGLYRHDCDDIAYVLPPNK